MFYRSETDRASHALLEEGHVESLVKEGRVPLLIDAFTGNNKAVICLIPPKGATPEDHVELNGGFFCVIGPSGKFKGTTSFNMLTPREADMVKERVKKALKPH